MHGNMNLKFTYVYLLHDVRTHIYDTGSLSDLLHLLDFFEIFYVKQ
jgi:hypothetical protein